MSSSHQLADRTSRALHAAVAERLRTHSAVLERARERVRGWEADGSVSAFYVEAWRELLDGPLDVLETFLASDTEHARSLRQASPFAGALAARERWQIWREVRAAREGS